jgi:hypothetical protein
MLQNYNQHVILNKLTSTIRSAAVVVDGCRLPSTEKKRQNLLEGESDVSSYPKVANVLLD